MVDTLIPIVQPTMPAWEAIADDLRDVFGNPQVTVGRFVRELEAAVAARLDVPHVIAVSSCTGGIMLAMRALELEGQVIAPPFTWCSTGQAALWNGLEPVFADIRPGTFTLDPAAVERAITPRTAAIIPVSVFGVPPDVDELQALAAHHGLRVVYDSAQALGATYKGRAVGGFGDVEIFSMSPTKVATSVEGGLITTGDAALAERLRRMRDYGKAPDGDIDLLGLSVRQTELHGLVGLYAVRALDDLIGARARVTARYRAGLEGIEGLGFQDVPADRTTTWNYMTVFVGPGARMSRDALQAALAERQIQTKRYFYRALHRQTVFAGRCVVPDGGLPVAEAASEQGLALPLFSHMTDAQVDRVIDAVRGALA